MLIYLPLKIIGIHLLAIFCKHVIKLGCKSAKVTNITLPAKAYKLRELVQNISPKGKNSDSDLSEVELIHNRARVGYREYDEDRETEATMSHI